MSVVHGFALDEESVIFGNDRTWLAFSVAKFEAEIGRLGEPTAVIVRALALTHDYFVGAATETRYAARLAEIVFDCTTECGSHVVLRSCCEIELLVTKKFKSSE
jgi:hypothetical protein